MVARPGRRIVGYVSCPECPNWSCGLQANGRLVRHSSDFGYVVREPGFRICKGSGKRVRPPKALAQEMA
jgi:hypothetical protein